jgi:hypothetical protein
MPAAVAHGSLSVSITERVDVSQPNALRPRRNGRRTRVPTSRSTARAACCFDAGRHLDEIVRAVNEVGAAPGRPRRDPRSAEAGRRAARRADRDLTGMSHGDRSSRASFADPPSLTALKRDARAQDSRPRCAKRPAVREPVHADAAEEHALAAERASIATCSTTSCPWRCRVGKGLGLADMMVRSSC